jgi:hypothetical protein
MIPPQAATPASRHMPGAFGFAVLGLTSLITTASGTLIAALSFAGQAGHLTAPHTFMAGVSAVAAALFVTLLATLGAYFSEAHFENGLHNRKPWAVAMGLVVLALVLLAAGMLMTLRAVALQVGGLAA